MSRAEALEQIEGEVKFEEKENHHKAKLAIKHLLDSGIYQLVQKAAETDRIHKYRTHVSRIRKTPSGTALFSISCKTGSLFGGDWMYEGVIIEVDSNGKIEFDAANRKDLTLEERKNEPGLVERSFRNALNEPRELYNHIALRTRLAGKNPHYRP